jgi:hypothetical protein
MAVIMRQVWSCEIRSYRGQILWRQAAFIATAVDMRVSLGYQIIKIRSGKAKSWEEGQSGYPALYDGIHL